MGVDCLQGSDNLLLRIAIFAEINACLNFQVEAQINDSLKDSTRVGIGVPGANRVEPESSDFLQG